MKQKKNLLKSTKPTNKIAPPLYIYENETVSALFIACIAFLIFSQCSSPAIPEKSSDKAITALTLTIDGKAYNATVHETDKTITVADIPFNTNLSAVTVTTISLSPKATASVQAGGMLTFNNNTATITVTAENGTTQNYNVNAAFAAPSPENTITALTLTIDGKAYNATVHETDKTITVADIPFNTNLSAVTVTTINLAPKATASVQAGGMLTFNNNTATITVTAENGTTQNYNVNVTFATPSTENTITALTLTIDGKAYNATVDEATKTIAVADIPFNTNLSAVTVTTINLAPKATASVQAGGMLTFNNNTATITVTAENGTTQNYNVNVTFAAPSPENTITALALTSGGKMYNAMIDETTKTAIITGGLPFGTDLSMVTVTTLTLSPNATASVEQGALLPINNQQATITVIAQDGAAQNYTVTFPLNTQFIITTYTKTDTLGQAIQDAPQGGTPILANADTIISVVNVADVAHTWTFGTESNTKMATNGVLALTKEELTSLSTLTANQMVAFSIAANGQTSTPKNIIYNPLEIRTWQDLQAMRQNLAGSYTLERNIVFPDKGAEGFDDDYNFEPIGRDTNKSNNAVYDGTPFSGNFNGDGYTISRLYINRADEDFVGFFGYVDGNRSVINGALINNDITGDTFIGGFVGYNNDGTVSGYATGNIAGRSQVGGLVGLNNTGSVCTGYSLGNVSGNFNIGGLVGGNDGGTVNGYATGNIVGNGAVGGLVGVSGSAGTVTGYFRGLVKRNSGQTNNTFGLLIGNVNVIGSGSGATGFHSAATDEGQLEGITAADALGTDGTAITVSGTTTQANFAAFTFGNAAGQWQWIAGRWPAIYLEMKPAIEQPTQP